MEVLDQTMDVTGRETYRVSQLYDLPDFVKNANADDRCGSAATPVTGFADPVNRRFPCHTPAAVVTSLIFLGEKRAALGDKQAAAVEANLDKAAAYFGITKTANEIKEKVAAKQIHSLQDLPDDDFALVVKYADDRVERHYPLRNGLETKAAAVWYAKYRDHLPYNDRRTIATKVLEKAAAYGADLGAEEELLSRAAGYGACATKTAVAAIANRVAIAAPKHQEIKAELWKLGAALQAEGVPTLANARLVKLAELLDQFDRATALTKLYDKGIERPEDELFVLTEKAAAAFVDEHVSTTTGKLYAKEALAALPLGTIRDWMGDDFAREVSAGGVVTDGEKLATIVTTLPRNDALLFDRMLEAVAVAPVLCEHDDGAYLGKEAMQALAELHAAKRVG